jgi:hypothetical protein
MGVLLLTNVRLGLRFEASTESKKLHEIANLIWAMNNIDQMKSPFQKSRGAAVSGEQKTSALSGGPSLPRATG